jgi:AcrR family transcriptional regulator
MNTKESILNVADHFIREQGFNAFSFHDISKAVGIKTASIHYYFPKKTDLGIAIIREHIRKLEVLRKKMEKVTPFAKFEAFLSIYSKIKSENKVCLVGSLATDLNTLDIAIKKELEVFSSLVINWLTEILQEGKDKNQFDFNILPRTKALMIITNLIAIVQLSRLTGDEDFEVVKQTIIKELKSVK